MDGFVADLQLVEVLVARLDAPQNLDGVFFVGLINHYWLEAPFEGGITFDVFAIFVKGSRPNGLELAP